MKNNEIKKWYCTVKTKINMRLAEFKTPKADREVFEELCFCILTANASARMGLNSISAIRRNLLNIDEEKLKIELKGKHRFYNARAGYIIHTREYLKKLCGLKMNKFLNSFEDVFILRKYIAENKDIKGIGYKEASHFLRNIGYSGLAILDKHILNCLKESGVIDLQDRKYTDIERKMAAFSKKIGIPMDELDLTLWSYKTGEILK